MQHVTYFAFYEFRIKPETVKLPMYPAQLFMCMLVPLAIKNTCHKQLFGPRSTSITLSFRWCSTREISKKGSPGAGKKNLILRSSSKLQAKPPLYLNDAAATKNAQQHQMSYGQQPASLILAASWGLAKMGPSLQPPYSSSQCSLLYGPEVGAAQLQIKLHWLAWAHPGMESE